MHAGEGRIEGSREGDHCRSVSGMAASAARRATLPFVSEREPALARRLRALNELALARYASFDALYEDHLQRGCQLLGLDTGIVSRIEGSRYEVMAVVTSLDGLARGDVFEVGGTYCAAVLHTGGTVAYDEVGALEEMRSHPVYVNMGLESYIAAPIRVFGRIHGTLNFSDRQPRARRFESWDHELVALMGVSIGRAIEREHEQRELERQRALFAAVFAALPDAVVLADERREIFMANPATKSVFGYEPEEVLGKKTVVLYGDPDAYQEAGRERYNRQASAEAAPYLMEYRRKDGTLFPGETVGVRVAGPDGELLGFLGHIRDVSERHEAERMKDELLSTVSHELRTPLTSIRGSLGLVASGAVPKIEGRAEDLVAMAVRNAERLEALVNDLLDVEKLGGGKVVLSIDDVPAHELVRGTVDANQGFAKRFEVSLVAADPVPDVSLPCDAGRVLQILDNLVSNAIKYSPKGDRVVVRATRVDDRVRFEVEDHGEGIPDELRPRIFGRFIQADSSDRREKGGTGLGLYIAKRLVELHHGEMGFEDGPDGGTLFWFELPAGQTNTAA